MAVRVGLVVRVRVMVGVTVEVGGRQGVRLLMRTPQLLRVPVSRAARSLTVSVQVPLPLSPAKADSGFAGLKDELAVGGQTAPIDWAAASSRVILLKLALAAALQVRSISTTVVPPGEVRLT